ncbi:VOC family protein [Streptomyces alkaliphilus]|uniref:VOC family protein n=1 Tax=Streptomyces alkaliphilus TaxID=1472722 RepID=A0A7W3T9V7_9ACTN|nr:VOC family protein [Streptomyces alkaliphilus]MBB0242924.1 VOC family protein [Streptomyces alkaliphilus]
MSAEQRGDAPATFRDLTLEALDHQRLADWWCEALGYRRRGTWAGETKPRPAEWPVAIHDPAGEGPTIWITPVEERGTSRNPVRLDVWGDSERLLAMGATMVSARSGARDWDVLADPEGNEFLVFPPPEEGLPVHPGVR